MDLDTMLKNLGQFGKFQANYFFMLLFPVMMCGYRSTEYIFTTMDIPHRCRIPECESGSEPVEFSPDWLRHAVPFTEDQKPAVCHRYRLWHNSSENISACSADLFYQNITEPCNDWVFAEPVRTISHDFNIMCPQDYWKRTLFSSLSVFTCFIGLPLGGFVSDRIGRRTAMLFSSGILCITGVVRSFSVSFNMLAALEMIDGILGGFIYSPAFLLGLETLAPSKRLLGSMLINIYFAVGEVELACVMWAVKNWRIMQRVFYFPMISITVALYWLLPESVRWLYTKGRYNDVEKIFLKIAKDNKTEEKLPDVISSLQSSLLADKDLRSKQNPEEPIMALRLKAVLKSQVIMWRLGACSLCWVASIYTYYGISQNSVSFRGNRYVSFMLVSLIEIPAYISSLWLPDIQVLGRRGTLAWSFILGGVVCLASSYVSSDKELLNLIMFLLAKFCSTLTLTVIYLYTAEIFPTELRQTLLSICSMTGRVGSILSQQTPLIAVYFNPMLLTGAISLIGGAFAFTCPETLNTKLPDTIQEAENIGRTVEHQQVLKK